MALRLKKQRDGKTLRPYWYGAYVEDGRQRVVTLSVRWKGTPPESGLVSDRGDAQFEESRKKAEDELAGFVDKARRKGRAGSLMERLIESKTGREVAYCRLGDLPSHWRSLGRESAPTERYFNACDAHFRRFIEFMATRNPKAVFLYQIGEPDAAAFVEACRMILAPGTARDCIQLLNTSFARFLPVGAANPFGALMGRRGNGKATIIHRQPFTPDELRALLETAREDAFMFPLIVCAAMTGMRRGDVCKLKWTDVDLAGGMLAVKTSKTDSSVEIPIFPMVRDVLNEAGGKGKGYVFPEAATMLEKNPDGLTWRFKKIVALAFANDAAALSDRTPAADVLKDGKKSIMEHVAEPVRAKRMINVLSRYAEGQSVREIEKETGIVRATISNDLRTIEVWTGQQFVRSNKGGAGIKASVNRVTRVAREKGQRAASVRDWHALRVTWITLALAAGVPMELVRRVTGHATVDVVLKHYFRPDREQFRAALSNALPDVLTGKGRRSSAQAKPADELMELATKISNGTATESDRKRFRVLAAKV